jgi:hypothetical protein
MPEGSIVRMGKLRESVRLSNPLTAEHLGMNRETLGARNR